MRLRKIFSFALLPASLFMMLVMALSVCSSLAGAQTFFGSIVGTVSDTSGAIVPGANVTITNLGTNESRTAKTDAAGEYRFVNLVPATYKISVEAANFKRFLRTTVAVTVDTTTRIDASLEIGAASETVEVTTQTPLLQTESGTLGDTVEGKQVEEIPLNGRNTLNLMALVPGVVPQGNTGGSAAMNNNGSTSSAAWGNYQIGGGLPLQGAIDIDGAPTSIMQKSFAVMVPTPDIVSEFKIETAGVSAEFGRLGGGVVNMTTKSGTNAFHGVVYEYLRNNVLNANTFFGKRNGAARPQWNQNQYGGAGGGPIWKNKAFFYFAWEEIHIRTGNPTFTNVPTAAMDSGVFSTLTKTPTSDPGPDGCTYAPYTGQTVTSITGKSGSFPAGGSYITNLSTCIDPTAKILATFYPTNYTGTTSNPLDNFFRTVSQGDDGHQITFRADWNITKNNVLFSRFTLWPLVDEIPNVLGNPNGWDSAGSQTHNHTNQIVVGDTHTINPTTVLDVRADYLRQYGDAIPPALGKVNVSQFGSAYATLAPFMSYQYYPAWTITGNHNLFNFSYNNLTRTWYNNYHISASLTKIVGKHSLKAGVEERLIQRDDTGLGGSPSGSYTIKADLQGDEWANFLQGYYDSGLLTTVKKTTSFSFYSGYYMQDTWQALPKLTLNVGLRFELPGAIAENGNNMAVLLPSVTDPITGITGTEGLVNSSLYLPRTSLYPVHNAFGPRLGFAYRLTNSTVIRGGYGLTYLPNDQQAGAYANAATINSQPTTNANTVSGTLKVNYTMSNPFPATAQLPNGVAPAQGRSYTNFMVANIGGNVAGPYPYEPYPASQGMNLSVSHQFKGDLLAEIGGAHTLGTHLNSLANIGLDQLPDQYDLLGTALAAGKDPNGNSINLSADGVKLAGSLQNYGQTLRPYPYYKNYANATDFHSTTSYNALEAKLQKRFKSTGQIGAAYTWSKLIGDTDSILTSQETKATGSAGEGVYQDYTNRRADRSIYSYNAPQRLVINYILNLPFGKGQMWASGVSGIADKAISGWAVDGITTFQTGYPLYFNLGGSTGSVSNTALATNYGAGTQRPNYTPGCAKTVPGSRYARTLSGAAWFNTTCFTVPGVGTPQQGYLFGNEPRVDRSLQMDGQKNWDFSVVKNTSIHDQFGTQFRVEFYNIFNRTQFAAPVTQADNSSFGTATQSQANKPRLIQAALRLNF